MDFKSPPQLPHDVGDLYVSNRGRKTYPKSYPKSSWISGFLDSANHGLKQLVTLKP